MEYNSLDYGCHLALGQFNSVTVSLAIEQIPAWAVHIGKSPVFIELLSTGHMFRGK